MKKTILILSAFEALAFNTFASPDYKGAMSNDTETTGIDEADSQNSPDTDIRKDSVRIIRMDSHIGQNVTTDVKYDTTKIKLRDRDLRAKEMKSSPLLNNSDLYMPDSLNSVGFKSATNMDYKGMAMKKSLFNFGKNNQEKTAKFDKWKVIGLYSAAIILNGIGDGMNNTNRKTMGHIFNAASIGVLLSSPFFVQYDKKKWYWYLLTYTSLRLALFDATYNVTTKQPIDFIGSTAITDKLYRKVGLGYDVSKSVGFVVGLTVPLRVL